MADVMEFPNTWEEYEKIYGFNDIDQVYTNGSRLIPSFRVKQWLDHIADRKTEQQTCNDCDQQRCETCVTEIGKTEQTEVNALYDQAEREAKECHAI